MECEYLVICPYKHQTDIVDTISGICYNRRTVDYYLENMKGKISEELDKIKLLQSIIDQHKCPVCKKEFYSNYVKLSCGDVVCLACSENIKKVNQNVCLICRKDIISIIELKIKDI
jgi:hypothetical protein